MLAALLPVVATAAVAVLFAVAVTAVVWCCCRLYPIARRRGLRPAGAVVLLGAGTAGGLVAGIVGVLVLPAQRWPDAVRDAAVVVAVLLGPLLGAALAVALVPRRRRGAAGPRSAPFLLSRGADRLAAGCRWTAYALVVAALSAPFWATWELAGRLLLMRVPLLGLPPLLDHYRERLALPATATALRADPRPPVLYLRPFAREGDAFTWLPVGEVGRYSRVPIPAHTWVRIWKVPVEQYLDRALTAAVGPVVALGNPQDVLPPEGAARLYAEDADDAWQHDFRRLAARAAVLLMTPSWSDELRWELAEVRRRGWHRKLVVVTPPATSRSRRADRAFARIIESARGVPRRPWPRTAALLRETGYAVDPAEPPPGSVIAFDDADGGGDDRDASAVLVAAGLTDPADYAAAVRGRAARATPP